MPTLHTTGERFAGRPGWPRAPHHADDPHLLGFGRFDMPDDDAWHGVERHRAARLASVDRLGRHDVLPVVQQRAAASRAPRRIRSDG